MYVSARVGRAGRVRLQLAVRRRNEYRRAAGRGARARVVCTTHACTDDTMPLYSRRGRCPRRYLLVEHAYPYRVVPAQLTSMAEERASTLKLESVIACRAVSADGSSRS